MKKSVILGTGPLGMAVMDELLDMGHPVLMVNRSGRLKENKPKGVEVIQCDLLDTQALQKKYVKTAKMSICARCQLIISGLKSLNH